MHGLYTPDDAELGLHRHCGGDNDEYNVGMMVENIEVVSSCAVLFVWIGSTMDLWAIRIIVPCLNKEKMCFTHLIFGFMCVQSSFFIHLFIHH